MTSLSQVILSRAAHTRVQRASASPRLQLSRGATLRLSIESLEPRLPLANIPVTTFADVIDPVDGFTSLREAVIQANGTAGDDTIELLAGNYELSIAGIGENAATRGDLDLTDTVGALTITGTGANQTTIDAKSIDRVFEIFSNVNAFFEDLAVVGGDTSSAGGGAHNDGTLTITRTSINNNSAGFGGGVENNGTLNVFHSDISNNNADFGAGIRNLRLGGGAGMLTINDSTLSGNMSQQGGGIFTNSSANIDGSTLADNSASISGGGIINGGSLMITDSVLADNSAGLGGGIRNSDRGELDVIRSMLVGNSANGEGGGIMNDGQVTITNSILSGNSADNGGAVENQNVATIINSSFSLNSATRGGAIRNANSFFSTGITDVFNSILWGDTATNDGNEIFVANGIVSAYYSDIEGGWVGPGSDNIDLDPKFADPDGTDDTAGTEDDDLRLLVMSPAIDMADTASGPLDDFFGQLRPIDGDNTLGSETDMGAVEYVPEPSTCLIILIGASCGVIVYRRRR